MSVGLLNYHAIGTLNFKMYINGFYKSRLPVKYYMIKIDRNIFSRYVGTYQLFYMHGITT